MGCSCYLLDSDWEYAVLPLHDRYAVYYRYAPDIRSPWRRCKEIPKCKSRREAQRRLDDYARQHGMRGQ